MPGIKVTNVVVQPIAGGHMSVGDGAACRMANTQEMSEKFAKLVGTKTASGQTIEGYNKSCLDSGYTGSIKEGNGYTSYFK